jgi:hypothetical protein
MNYRPCHSYFVNRNLNYQYSRINTYFYTLLKNDPLHFTSRSATVCRVPWSISCPRAELRGCINNVLATHDTLASASRPAPSPCSPTTAACSRPAPTSSARSPTRWPAPRRRPGTCSYSTAAATARSSGRPAPPRPRPRRAPGRGHRALRLEPHQWLIVVLAIFSYVHHHRERARASFWHA